jgi:DNA primase
LYFSKAIFWICKVCGYNYYDNEEEEIENPFLACIDAVTPKSQRNEEETLNRLDEDILKQYIICPNKWFYDDGISLQTQKEFEIGFSVYEERITIPIRDELGNLVGIKGRTIDPNYKDKGIFKYISLYKFPKTKVLYGLYKTFDYIKEKGIVIVFESEKSVQQCWSMGIKYTTAILGHDFSLTQIVKLEKLGVKIIFAFDKGIDLEEIKKQGERFLIKDNIYFIWDHLNLLPDKASPSDLGKECLEELLKTSVYKFEKINSMINKIKYNKKEGE